jgi:hypothetical protein
MNALQEEDAVSLDYNPVVEGVMGGLIPSTSRSMRVESSSLQQMELKPERAETEEGLKSGIRADSVLCICIHSG